MFDINNSLDFYAKLLADFDDFMADPGSGRLAMNCAITAHHMHDWVWVDWLKKDKEQRDKLGVTDKKSFMQWIDRSSVWFSIVQQISNGSKHFNQTEGFEAIRVGGWGVGQWGAGGFGQSHLVIDNGEAAGNSRFMAVPALLEVVVRFWRDFFTAHSPYKSLPVGKTELLIKL